MLDINGKTGLMIGINSISFEKVLFNLKNFKASTNGNADVVDVLIRNGAQINLQDTLGNTALIYGIL